MAKKTYTLSADDLGRIRNALSFAEIERRDRAQQSRLPEIKRELWDEAVALGELRDRLYGTKSVVITYPEEV